MAKSNKHAVVEIEKGVPLPPRSNFLPDIPLEDMDVDESAFVEIDYGKQQGAVRQRVYRFQKKFPGRKFSVLKTTKKGKHGVRIYRLS